MHLARTLRPLKKSETVLVWKTLRTKEEVVGFGDKGLLGGV